MTATWAGLPHPTGPLAPAPYSPSPLLRCGCDGATQECGRCSGEFADEAAVDRGYRQAQRDRERLMKTPAYRLAWLRTFDPSMRADMAAAANREFGELALGAVDTGEEAA